MSSFETIEHETFDTIFRDAGHNGKSVSPTVAKANPINDPFGNLVGSFPSIVEFEAVEESTDLPDDISGEWAIEDDDGQSSSTDLYPIQTVTPLAADTKSSLYSFYFEDTMMNLSEDDNSVSLHDDVTLEDADYCLDNIRDNPEGFWSDSAMMMTQERRSSPAQISLSSDTFAELQRIDSL
jgi:hypothetical protein